MKDPYFEPADKRERAALRKARQRGQTFNNMIRKYNRGERTLLDSVTPPWDLETKRCSYSGLKCDVISIDELDVDAFEQFDTATLELIDSLTIEFDLEIALADEPPY